ncbi:MAG: hypothetical protein BGO77_08565 [Caedibacter sp. 37-49]|nr:MAG: hypothetical protein BGO77_08565 [Caedibacter sp. 37-49]
MAQKQDRKDYWQQTIEKFLSSGLSQDEYAKQHKISKASLYKWSKRLSIPLTAFKKTPLESQAQPLTFIKIPSVSVSRDSIPLKLEIMGVRGSSIKAEMSVVLEQVASLLKALIV